MDSHTEEKCDDVPSRIFFTASGDEICYESGKYHMHDNRSKISGDSQTDTWVLKKIDDIFYEGKSQS